MKLNKLKKIDWKFETDIIKIKILCFLLRRISSRTLRLKKKLEKNIIFQNKVCAYMLKIRNVKL